MERRQSGQGICNWGSDRAVSSLASAFASSVQVIIQEKPANQKAAKESQSREPSPHSTDFKDLPEHCTGVASEQTEGEDRACFLTQQQQVLHHAVLAEAIWGAQISDPPRGLQGVPLSPANCRPGLVKCQDFTNAQCYPGHSLLITSVGSKQGRVTLSPLPSHPGKYQWRHSGKPELFPPSSKQGFPLPLMCQQKSKGEPRIPLLGGSNQVAPRSAPKTVSERAGKTVFLEDTDSHNVTHKMSRLQLRVIHVTKKNEDCNLNEKK